MVLPALGRQVERLLSVFTVHILHMSHDLLFSWFVSKIIITIKCVCS